MAQYKYLGTDCDFGRDVGRINHGQLVEVPDDRKAEFIRNKDEWQLLPANVQTDVDLALLDSIRRMSREELLAACKEASKLDPEFRFEKKWPEELLTAALLRASVKKEVPAPDQQQEQAAEQQPT